ncbi:MAG: ankyrin repeat domain-containing protein [Spirochaetes bacterium]|nr:ankyrin repeat domain-containing protein [Spirochaetota bacterium]
MKKIKFSVFLFISIFLIISCSILRYSPLIRAVYNNDIKKVNELINQGADVNENRNTSKNTPLMWALANNNYEMTKLLIERGADVNENNNNKTYSSLMWACEKGNIDILKLLIKNGANVNAYYVEKYYTALCVAIEWHDYKNNNNNALILFLLKKGARVYNEHLKIADEIGGFEKDTLRLLRKSVNKNIADTGDITDTKDKEPAPVTIIKMNKGKLVGLIKSVDVKSNEIIVSSVVIGRLVNLGDTLYCVIDGDKINMEVTFPMQTIAKCKAAHKKDVKKFIVGETVYK